jgi:hypothetical protein
MGDLDQITMGKLIEAVDTLKSVCDKLEVKVDTLNSKITSIEGSWKAVAGVAATIGGLVSVGVIKVAPFLGVFPK